MANTFKVKSNTAMPTSAGSWEALYTCPASTTTVCLGLILCNIHTTAITADVQLESNTADTETNANVYLIKDVSIPAGSSLEVLSGSKVVLKETDVINIDCDVSAKIDAALSIMEIT